MLMTSTCPIGVRVTYHVVTDGNEITLGDALHASCTLVTSACSGELLVVSGVDVLLDQLEA
jgi:hypothetical protein